MLSSHSSLALKTRALPISYTCQSLPTGTSTCASSYKQDVSRFPGVRMEASASSGAPVPVVRHESENKLIKRRVGTASTSSASASSASSLPATMNGRVQAATNHSQLINGAVQTATPATATTTANDTKTGSNVELSTFPWVPEGSLQASTAEKQGLGIKKFLKDKKILVTGATGFLAKVLVEKILRTEPDVGHIFLLINAKSSQAARERLRKEIQGSRLFQVLQDKHGDEYEEFIHTKVTAVAGNVAKENMGMESLVARDLMNQVDVIVNSAATTNFVERYDVALDINTKGPLHLLEFAKKCHRLQLFLHVSTAYVNGKRVGRALEKPFGMDESIARDSLGDQSAPQLSVLEEIESVRKLTAVAPAHDKDEVAQQTAFMKELGLKRAALHGWQDTYVFTKAMGEMLVCENRQNVPVVILRPTVVEGTLSQPFSGWMEGIRMMDPILLTYGKGQMSSFYVDPNGVLDVVPADMVVNCMLASMAKHAGQGASLHIYQVGSSVVNPLTFGKLANYTYEHFQSRPFVDQKGNPVVPPRMTFITNKYMLFIYNFIQFGLPVLLAKVFPWMQREDTQRRLKYLSYASQRVKQLIDTYSAYTFYKGRFDIANVQKLYRELSAEEREEFGFAVWTVEWDRYIKNVHLPGLRKYTLEGNTAFRL